MIDGPLHSTKNSNLKKKRSQKYERAKKYVNPKLDHPNNHTAPNLGSIRRKKIKLFLQIPQIQFSELWTPWNRLENLTWLSNYRNGSSQFKCPASNWLLRSVKISRCTWQIPQLLVDQRGLSTAAYVPIKTTMFQSRWANIRFKSRTDDQAALGEIR